MVWRNADGTAIRCATASTADRCKAFNSGARSAPMAKTAEITFSTTANKDPWTNTIAAVINTPPNANRANGGYRAGRVA